GAGAEGRSPQDRYGDERGDLEGAHGDGDGQVAEDHRRSRNGRGQVVALGAAFAIDDHGDAAEHAAEGDEQADRADGDEAEVVDWTAGGHGLGQGGCDNRREQDGREQWYEDFAGGVCAETEAPAREGREPGERWPGHARVRRL